MLDVIESWFYGSMELKADRKDSNRRLQPSLSGDNGGGLVEIVDGKSEGELCIIKHTGTEG